MSPNSRLAVFGPYLKRYRLALAGLGGLLVLTTLGEGVGIGLFYPLIDFIQRGPGFTASGPSAKLAALLAVAGLPATPPAIVGLIFGAISTTLALKWASAAQAARVYDALTRDLREDAFARLVESHLFEFHAASSSKLIQTLEDDVEHVGQAVNFGVAAVSSALSILVFSAGIVLLSWKLAALVAALAALRYSVSGLFIRARRRLGAEHAELRGRLKSTTIGVYQGIDVIKTFATEAAERAAFSSLAGAIQENSTALAGNLAAGAFFEGLLGDGALCVLVYLGVSRLGVSGPALLTFLVIVSRIVPKVTAINDARIRISEYLGRIARLPDVLREGGLSRLPWGSRRLPRFERELRCEGVSFRYPGAGAPALTDIDLAIRRNETVALIGASGAGKTTLAKLLLRLFDPTAGRVLADGVPLTEAAREDWTRLIGVVSQETFIFDDTVEANVKYGSPGCSDARFREALRRARADEFVAALPERERTRLGERGASLSGGQRQRVAIARAFLRGCPILILDEATSAMDAVTEKLIQDSIEELARDRTMIVIAHRFTTIRNADRIVVLDGGRIAEAGSHEQLVEAGSLYQKYRDLQLF